MSATKTRKATKSEMIDAFALELAIKRIGVKVDLPPGQYVFDRTYHLSGAFEVGEPTTRQGKPTITVTPEELLGAVFAVTKFEDRDGVIKKAMALVKKARTQEAAKRTIDDFRDLTKNALAAHAEKMGLIHTPDPIPVAGRKTGSCEFECVELVD